MTATKQEAARVVADLTTKAEACPQTTLGRREAQNLYTAAATIELTYGIGNFA
jgi:hypothetical protein